MGNFALSLLPVVVVVYSFSLAQLQLHFPRISFSASFLVRVSHQKLWRKVQNIEVKQQVLFSEGLREVPQPLPLTHGVTDPRVHFLSVGSSWAAATAASPGSPWPASSILRPEMYAALWLQ